MTTLDEFMAAIRQVESGGRYAIGKNGSGASGAYQFIDSTWGGFGGYSSAYLAPPEVQDERARQLMQAYYDQFGDWDHVAAAWIGGPGTAEKGPGAWGGIHDSNMSVAAYVQRVRSVMGAGSAGVGATATGASFGAAATGGASGMATVQQSLGSKLTGALGAVGGPKPPTVYTQTSAQHGDTLGDRLQAIHDMLTGGGPASV